MLEFLILVFSVLLMGFRLVSGVSDKILTTPESDEIVIAFGSCNDPVGENTTSKIFDTITKFDPSVFIWLGDVAYTDDEGPFPYFYPLFDGPFPGLEKYKFLMNASMNDETYSRFAKNRHIIGMWDDHDYGKNDGDKTFPFKEQTRQLWLDAFGEPKDSPRRTRAGIYESYYIGSEKLVKVILLDGRFNKDPARFFGNHNLGEEQWKWLEEELKTNTAQVVLIGSGYQILMDDRFTSEVWFRSEVEKLLALIKKYRIEGVVLLSGDIHMAELSCHPCSYQKVGYNIYEVTSSGLTHYLAAWFKRFLDVYPPTTYRVNGTKFYQGYNFGLITIKTDKGKVVSLNFEVKDINGSTVLQLPLVYEDLQFNTSRPVFGKESDGCVVDDYSRLYRSFRYHVFNFSREGIMVTLAFLTLLVFIPFGLLFILICVPIKLLVRWKRTQKVKQKKE